MDIMRTGYILPLWVDLGFSYDECTPEECGDENCPRTSIHVDWKESIGEGRLQSKFGKVVESRAWSSWGNIPELETSVPNSSMTFINPWTIKTPPGYSSLITQPFNNINYPHPQIKTFTGLVNTDTYFNPVTYFFHVKAPFTGIIKKGTPLVQVVPIKREEWQHTVTPISWGDENNIQNRSERAYLSSKIED